VPLVGQVYGTERATLIQGDCLEVMRELDSWSIDAVITDPPYGVDYRGRWGSKQKPIINDSSNWWIPTLASELFRILPVSGFVICFYGWPTAGVFLDAFNAAGFRPTSHLVFIKNMWGLGYHTRSKHEVAYLFAKGKVKPQIVDTDVFPWTRVRNRVRPTQKPLDSILPLAMRFCQDEGTILDPFMGSGTTGVAAIQTGRRFIGIETDPVYCAIARERLAKAELACVKQKET
jgi:DNA modification methylase